jgi:hypothetical protein
VKWGWAEGKTIPAFLKDSGRSVPDKDEKLLKMLLCIAVLHAQDALGAKIDKWRAESNDDERLRQVLDRLIRTGSVG